MRGAVGSAPSGAGVVLALALVFGLAIVVVVGLT